MTTLKRLVFRVLTVAIPAAVVLAIPAAFLALGAAAIEHEASQPRTQYLGDVEDWQTRQMRAEMDPWHSCP